MPEAPEAVRFDADHLPTLSQYRAVLAGTLRDESGGTWTGSPQELRTLRDLWFDRFSVLNRRSSLTSEEEHSLELATREVERFSDEIARGGSLDDVDRSNLPTPNSGRSIDERSESLTPQQRMVDFIEVRGRGGFPAGDGTGGDGGANLRLAPVLRGMVTGNWEGAEHEYRAMGITPGSAGGFVVPDRLSAEVLDQARAATQVIAAGAQTFPLTTDQTHVAKVTGDPQAAWRAEHGVIPESDMTLGRVTFQPAALACITRVSRELFEDSSPNIESTLRSSIAKAVAVEIDRVALRGSGAGSEPTGLLNTVGVGGVVLGAGNGATPTYGDVIGSLGRVQDANYPPSAVIWAPRTARTFAALTDANGQFVAPPEMVADVARLATTQVPTNLTVGTSTDCSEWYTGDFAQLFIGMRTRLQIQALTERYADVGEIGFLTWIRADVQVGYPTAFDVVTGVRP